MALMTAKKRIEFPLPLVSLGSTFNQHPGSSARPAALNFFRPAASLLDGILACTGFG
jgi:hypothetical protein